MVPSSCASGAGQQRPENVRRRRSSTRRLARDWTRSDAQPPTRAFVSARAMSLMRPTPSQQPAMTVTMQGPSSATDASPSTDSPPSIPELLLICQSGPPDTDLRRRADTICNQLIKPVTGGTFEVVRFDCDRTPAQIPASVIKAIHDATVVVADLAGQNPKAYYLLAVADFFHVPTILLMDTLHSSPFDRGEGTTVPIGEQQWPITLEKGVETHAELHKILDLILSGNYKVTSPIADAERLEALALKSTQDDPVAQELVCMRRSVEEIRRLLTRPARTTMSDNTIRDVRRLVGLVSNLVSDGRLTREDLDTLIVPGKTTSNFEGWVNNLIHRLPSSTIDTDGTPF